MKFNYFIEWYFNLIKLSEKYTTEDDTIKLVITYPIIIFDQKKIKYLRPKYPWNNKILLNMNKIIDDENKTITLIKEKDKLIEEQQKIIEKLKNGTFKT